MVFKQRAFYGEAPEEVHAENQADLETRVANVMATANGLDAADVTVVSEGNTIVLSGTVASSEEVARAREVADSVAGVAEVVNRIAVA